MLPNLPHPKRTHFQHCFKTVFLGLMIWRAMLSPGFPKLFKVDITFQQCCLTCRLSSRARAHSVIILRASLDSDTKFHLQYVENKKKNNHHHHHHHHHRHHHRHHHHHHHHHHHYRHHHHHHHHRLHCVCVCVPSCGQPAVLLYSVVKQGWVEQLAKRPGELAKGSVCVTGSDEKFGTC